jgi:DNA-binding NtrC family response regulator
MPTIRSSAAELARLLGRTTAGVYAVDDRRRIVFLNEVCREWIGPQAEELLGVECRYHSVPDENGQVPWPAALCPPPEAFRGQHQVSFLPTPDGQGGTVSRRYEFLPLAGGDELAGVLVIVWPTPIADGETAAALADEPPATRLHADLMRYRRLQREHFHADRLVGETPAIKRVRAQVALAAGSTASVLVIGPQGSGRQHIAKAIHFARGTATIGPLVPLACPLLDPELLQATIRGLARPKLNIAPRPATLVLNDVDQMPQSAQAELLGFLRVAELPLRIISTSRYSLSDLTIETAFRPELAAQLSTLTIELPALAERLDDLPLLAQAFLEQINAEQPRQVSGFTPEALDVLAGYAWPGNLDELAELARQAHQRAEGPFVTPHDLPQRIFLAADAARHARPPEETIVLEKFLAEIERELIERALAQAKGNKTKAAELLGMTRPRLYRRLVQLGLAEGEDES